jgi:hypothetical protein
MTDKGTTVTRGPLDFVPLLVGHKICPGSDFRLLVRPPEKVDELDSLFCFGLPNGNDLQSVAVHYAGCVITEACVEGIFVRLKIS